MKQQNIEKLFKDNFSNFEADVNSGMWANIEQSLPAPAPQNPGGSPAVKPAGFFGKMSLNTVILVSAISAILIGTSVYLMSDKPAQDTLVQVQPQTIKDHVIVSETSPAAPLNSVPVEESKNVAEKQTANKGEVGKVHLMNPPQQTVSEKQTENVSNSVQVLTEKNSESQLTAVKTDVKENATASIERPSEQGRPVIENKQDGSKIYTHPSAESSPAVTGITPSVAPVEEEISAESSEEFHFFIPNVFSPNGDMQNDNFKPIASGSLKDYEMTIFDRSGFEIFKSRDIAFGWDGKLKDGSMAASLVYVYRIKLTDNKGELHEYLKHVMLLK